MYDWLNHCKMPEIHEINHLSIFPTVTRIRDVNHQAFFLWADEVAKKAIHVLYCKPLTQIYYCIPENCRSQFETKEQSVSIFVKWLDLSSMCLLRMNFQGMMTLVKEIYYITCLIFILVKEVMAS